MYKYIYTCLCTYMFICMCIYLYITIAKSICIYMYTILHVPSLNRILEDEYGDNNDRRYTICDASSDGSIRGVIENGY